MATIQLSGQITVTTAGTEVQGGNIACDGIFVKAMSTNTGKVYIGNDGAGAVASTTGYELSAGEQVYLNIKNLNLLWVDASADAQKVCWLKAEAAG